MSCKRIDRCDAGSVMCLLRVGRHVSGTRFDRVNVLRVIWVWSVLSLLRILVISDYILDWVVGILHTSCFFYFFFIHAFQGRGLLSLCWIYARPNCVSMVQTVVLSHYEGCSLDMRPWMMISSVQVEYKRCICCGNGGDV